MNSLSFSLPDLVNPESIEWPLNNVFTNKYGKYDADREIMNIYKNLKIVWSQFFPDMSFIFGLLGISIGLLVFGLIANKYKQIAIRSLSTIHNTWFNIRWMIQKMKKQLFAAT
jgi:hypothetical protein